MVGPQPWTRDLSLTSFATRNLQEMRVRYAQHNRIFPQQRKLGVSAKLGTGALWGSHPVRFPEVPRFPVKVPRFQVKVPSQGSEGSEVPSEGPVSSVQRVPNKGSK